MDFLGAKSGNANRIWTGGESLDKDILGMQALGSAIIAEPIGFNLSSSGGNAFNLNNQIAWFTAIYLPKPATLTGLCFSLSQAFVGTGNNNNVVGLYSYSAGTLTRVAISTANNNLFKATAKTIVKTAFTGTYAAVAGVYYGAFLYCQSAQTTAPAAYGSGSNNTDVFQSGMDFTNSAFLSGTLSGQTNLPTSQAASGISKSTQKPWMAVY